MNQRIKELADSSDLYDGCHCGIDRIEKFAKLIIQECVDVASTSVNNDQPWPGPEAWDEPYEAWYLIERHFGMGENKE